MLSASNDSTPLSTGARYVYIELRPGAAPEPGDDGFSRLTIVNPHRLSSAVAISGNAGFRRDTISWRLCFPANCRAPVPPMLNFPCTNGIRSLLDRFKERNVAGKRE